MKLRINCMECFKEYGKPSTDFKNIEITDNGLYKSTCDNGHTTLTMLQEQKFEVLFDIGAMALIDGYPREAITSFAASLERFYEFYIKIISIKHGVNKEILNKTWKKIDSQSERQYGTYLFLYLLDHKYILPPTIDDEKPDISEKSKKNTKNWREFRNSVVHKGFIPSFEEALKYGDIVYRHILELIKDLHENSGKYIHEIIILNNSSKIENNKFPIQTMSIPTIINLSRKENSEESLEKALKNINEYQKWIVKK